jgi:hypothetical protein
MSHRKIRIGRSRDNDIILDHSSVSRHHLELFYDEFGNVFLTDLNSSNGTFVNGKRIVGSIQLNHNDIVKAGLSDPIPWRNYLTSHSSSSGGAYRTDPSYTPRYEQQNNSGGPWKTIAITLSVVVAVVGIGFFMNEYVLGDDKPDEIDPDKPNNEEVQPEKKEEKNKEITYDFSCLKDDNDLGTTEIIDVLGGLDSEVTNALGGEVSIEEEEEVGDQLLRDVQDNYNLIEAGNKIKNLRGLLKRLVDQIKDPKGYHYKIYLIESDELNAFTAGAKIFVTTRMYEFCRSNDELACVIGHEINHNELGHIKEHIQKTNILGEEGAGLAQFATIPFGQKKETHCDLTGIDLVIAAGYNGCVNIELWKRMKNEFQEGEYNAFENMFRSHPYSEKRANCSHNHILKNYGFDCDTKEEVE